MKTVSKFEFTGETKIYLGVTLNRIRAIINIEADVKIGDIGGWIEKRKSLNESDNSWVSGDAYVFGNAVVSGNAYVFGDAIVSGDASVSGNAIVSGDARVSGNAVVSGNAYVFGDAIVSGDARVSGNAVVSGNAYVFGDARVFGNAYVFGDARVFGNACITSKIIAATRSDGYLFILARHQTSDGYPVILAGCQYFTFAQAREHWSKTRGGTRLGDESLALVDHLERMARIARIPLDATGA